jgi:hypothetical protein
LVNFLVALALMTAALVVEVELVVLVATLPEILEALVAQALRLTRHGQPQ